MENLVMIGEAARRLGVSVGTVRRWFDDAKISGVRSPTNRRMIYSGGINAILRGRSDEQTGEGDDETD